MTEQPIESAIDAEVYEDVEDVTLDEATEDAPEAHVEGKVIAIRPGVGSLGIAPDQESFTPAQWEALVGIGLGDAPVGVLRNFLHMCQATGLDPFRREVYLIGRKDRTSPTGMKWTYQTGIDGFRHIAERSGEYRGRTVEWCGEDGLWREVWLGKTPPAAARVGILREGMAVAIYGVATYDEFCPVYDGKPQGLWNKMPAQMLAKVAEAQAIRAAFPRQASNLYAKEEMEQADQEERSEQVERIAARRRQHRTDAATAGERRAEAAQAARDAEVEDAVLVGEVVDEAAPPSRDLVWAELEAQASALGVEVSRLTNRWVKANRRNIDTATPEELAALVVSLRPTVAEHLRPTHPAVADEYGKAVDPFVDLVTMLAFATPPGEDEGE